MRTAVSIGIGVLALVLIIAYYWFLFLGLGGPTQPAPQQAALVLDLYPLYEPAPWNAPHESSFQLPGGTSIAGARIEAPVATSTMDPGSYVSPFETYYRQKLQTAGWEIDNSLLANGPASGQVVWRKSSEMVALQFDTIFHVKPAESPEQCPCDVTLSLFSSDNATSS